MRPYHRQKLPVRTSSKRQSKLGFRVGAFKGGFGLIRSDVAGSLVLPKALAENSTSNELYVFREYPSPIIIKA